MFPLILYFKSDDTIAHFIQQLKSSDKMKLSEPTAEYKWSDKTIGKSGKTFSISLSRIGYLKSVKLLTTND